MSARAALTAPRTWRKGDRRISASVSSPSRNLRNAAAHAAITRGLSADDDDDDDDDDDGFPPSGAGMLATTAAITDDAPSSPFLRENGGQSTLIRMRRGAAAAFASDFAHHAPGVARLNHGSFGAAPLPVLQACAAWRDTWLAQPDALYFAGRLEEKIRNAEHAAETALAAPRGTVALVENATVAAAITLRRWCTETSSSSKALVLSCAYGGLLPSLRTAFPGDRLVEVEVPFPGTTHAAILERLDRALLANRGGDGIAFALLDHVASQPALELPIRDVIALCRERGVREVAVDAAHAVGNVAGATDVTALDADVWWTNFHKWGHAVERGVLECVLRTLLKTSIGRAGADVHGAVRARSALARRAVVGRGGFERRARIAVARDARFRRGRQPDRRRGVRSDVALGRRPRHGDL